MIRYLLSVATTGLLLLPFGAAVARTWIVAQDGSGDFTLLTAAYTAAASGDTVLIRPGSYEEPEYNGYDKPPFVTSKSLTTIGTGSEPSDVAISMDLQFDGATRTVVHNVLFHNANSPLHVSGNSEEATVSNCVFEDNGSRPGSGGLGVSGPVIVESCVFRRNSAAKFFGGGAISVFRGPATIRSCIFDSNTSEDKGGAVSVEGGYDRLVQIEDCVFLKNRTWDDGAAIFAWADTEIRYCTFWRNEGPATIGVVDLTPPCPVHHCIVAGTVGGVGVAAYAHQRIECCDYWQNEFGLCGGCAPIGWDGSFEADPLFCDPDHGDFGLQDGSPCLNGTGGGWPCGLIGAQGLGCGESPVEPMTWGRVKMTFR